MTGKRRYPDADPLAAELYAKIRTLRKLRRMSVQKLADQMVAQGYKITRSQAAAGELGFRQAMPIDFADHAARALGITLVELLTQPAVCQGCKGEPPAGFTCNVCGTAGGGS